MQDHALTRQHEADRLAARLPDLMVAAQRVANTVAQGVHGRRKVGTGETFWQYRHYEPGEAAHRIDWRKSARSDELLIRENEWEAAQTVWLWRDGSASMDWRSRSSLPTKKQRADLLALALSTLLIRGGEAVALTGLGGRPGRNVAALERIARGLVAPQAAPESATNPDLEMLETLPRHAHLVLFSDFLVPVDLLHRTLSRLAERRLQGHLVQVLDPAEESLPFRGRVEFLGLEGETAELVPRVESVRASYLERLAAHRRALVEICGRLGWGHQLHSTDRPPQEALLALFMGLAGETGHPVR